MRKIVVLTFISLDGVMQAPGGPREDVSGGFKFGGWTWPYFDEASNAAMGKQMAIKADLLLGRTTFEIFAAYWPDHEEGWPGVNAAVKYVASSTLSSHRWNNSVFLGGNAAGAIRKLKAQAGPDLHVYGSSGLVQTLFREDLVDELWLKIFPVVLGEGKRLFGRGTPPAGFRLLGSESTPSGVIFASYARDGEVKTGSF